MNLQEYKKLTFDEREKLPKKVRKEMEQLRHADYLQEMLCNIKPDSEGKIAIYCIIGSVAKSGMSRRIKLFIVEEEKIIRISHLASKVLELNLNDNGIRIDGCGMDMGFAMVEDLQWKLNKILGTAFNLKHVWL